MTYAEARDAEMTGDIHHMFIMESDQTHRKLGKVLGLKAAKSVKRKRATVTHIRNTARPDEALVFTARLPTSRSRSKSIRRKIAAAERSVARLAPGERECLAHRILMDIGNRPAPPQVLGGRPNTAAERSEEPNLRAQRSG
jgi:hypothetical protein